MCMPGTGVEMSKNANSHILPFLWVHGEDEETYRHMVRVIHDANMWEFCIEARPHPDFCGEDWWHDLDIILDEAQKLGMRAWILDDRHFPTGFANGAVMNAPLGLRRRHLTHRSVAVRPGKRININIDRAVRPHDQLGPVDYALLLYGNEGKLPKKIKRDEFLAVVGMGPGAMPLDLTDTVRDGRLALNVPQGITSLEVIGLTYDSGFHRSYINMLDPDSCRILIDAVYEPHFQHLGDRFGSVIAGFFSDEPELGNGIYTRHGNVLGTEQTLPWSELLGDRLRERLGDSWRSLLPLLWVDGGDARETARARYRYMDCVTRLVESCFSEQIGSWCREHGVEYIGHVIEDNNQHARTSTSLGHYFRGLRGQSMAGIDDIGGQVRPGGEDACDRTQLGYENDGEFYHYALGKLGSSLAAIEPHMHGRAMCEIFGNYGWSEGVRLEKYLIDHFLVRGINHFVPHAFTCSPYPEKDCPPHFYAQGNNPEYRHFGALMAYTEHLCSLFDGGSVNAPVAILYHAEAEWCGKAMLMQKPARVLADNQIDFNFVPADVLSEREHYGTQIDAAGFQVNGRRYRALVIPEAEFIPVEVAQAALEMPCRVLFINALPHGLCTGEPAPEGLSACRVVTLEQLLGAVRGLIPPAATIAPASKRIRIMHYLTEDGSERYFMVNEGVETWRGSLLVPKTGDTGPDFFAYDAWSDRSYRIAHHDGAYQLELAPSQSIVLRNDSELDALPCDPEQPCGDGIEITEFELSICRAIDYPRFEQKGLVSTPHDLASTNPRFSGFLRYEADIALPTVINHAVLEITDAGEAVEVFTNGKSAGIKVVPPFRFDITALVHAGSNHLTIEVATTLERERNGAKGAAPIGLTGQVRLHVV